MVWVGEGTSIHSHDLKFLRLEHAVILGFFYSLTDFSKWVQKKDHSFIGKYAWILSNILFNNTEVNEETSKGGVLSQTNGIRKVIPAQLWLGEAS